MSTAPSSFPPIFTKQGLMYNSKKIDSVLSKSYAMTSTTTTTKILEQKHFSEPMRDESPTPPPAVMNFHDPDLDVSREDLEALELRMRSRMQTVREREANLSELRDRLNKDMERLRAQQQEFEREKDRFRQRHGRAIAFKPVQVGDQPACPQCGVNLPEQSVPWMTDEMNRIGDARMKLEDRERVVAEREKEYEKRRQIFEDERSDWRLYSKRMEDTARKKRDELNVQQTVLNRKKAEFLMHVEQFNAARRTFEDQRGTAFAQVQQEKNRLELLQRELEDERRMLDNRRSEFERFQGQLSQLRDDAEISRKYCHSLEEKLAIENQHTDKLEQEFTDSKKNSLQMAKKFEDLNRELEALKKELEETLYRERVYKEQCKRSDSYITQIVHDSDVRDHRMLKDRLVNMSRES